MEGRGWGKEFVDEAWRRGGWRGEEGGETGMVHKAVWLKACRTGGRMWWVVPYAWQAECADNVCSITTASERQRVEDRG